MELCEENKHNKVNLLKLIKKHVLPGTIVMTDKWAAYKNLPLLGFQHLTVTYSLLHGSHKVGEHADHRVNMKGT